MATQTCGEGGRTYSTTVTGNMHDNKWKASLQIYFSLIVGYMLWISFHLPQDRSMDIGSYQRVADKLKILSSTCIHASARTK